MPRRRLTPWFWLLGSFTFGCATSWPKPSELSTEEARNSARQRAKATLQDRDLDLGDRASAAQLLGALGSPSLGGVPVLGRVLGDATEPDLLRAHAAWALGALDEESSLDALISALPTVSGERAPEYLLDALWTKQDQIFADPEVQADLAEALNTFLATPQGRGPRSARALQRRVATLPVSVRVLDRAIGAWLEEASAENELVLVRSIRTVLRRLDQGLPERQRRPDEAWVEVKEAVFFLQRASLVAGPAVRRRVWSSVGARTHETLLARAVAEAFFGAEGPVPGRPTHAPRPAERLIGAWLAERVLLSRPAVRAALYDDLLLWESSPEVFALLSDLARARDVDLVRELAP